MTMMMMMVLMTTNHWKHNNNHQLKHHFKSDNLPTYLPWANDAWHALHCWLRIIYSTTTVCCNIAPLITSFCTVSLIFNLNEWGSVHIHTASMSFTFDSPCILRRHIAINSFDSSCIVCQGGANHLVVYRWWWWWWCDNMDDWRYYISTSMYIHLSIYTSNKSICITMQHHH